MRSGTLSIVIPAYNESGLIAPVIQALHEALDPARINFNIVLVNDGSTDDTWAQIEVAQQQNPQVTGVCFSRNFGKEAAIFAGLQYAQGDCVAVMDADLQHPPVTLVEMYRTWQEGFEVVNAVKATRGKESFLYKLGARTFYRVLSSSTGVDMNGAADFKLMDRKVVNTLVGLDERHLFFRGLSTWVGYKTADVEFNVAQRASGTTKWNKASLLKYAIKNITAFSTGPLQLVSICGVLFLIFAIVVSVQSLVKYFSGTAITGFTTVILLLLIVGSIIMMSLGIIGIYIARIYEEIKRRPRFIVSEVIKGGANPDDRD